MSTLKEKFDSYTPQPDSRVWQSVSSTLSAQRAAIRHRRIAVVSAAAAVTGVALFFVLRGSSNPAAPQLAAVPSQPAATAQSASEATEPVTTTSQQTAVVYAEEKAPVATTQMQAVAANNPSDVTEQSISVQNEQPTAVAAASQQAPTATATRSETTKATPSAVSANHAGEVAASTATSSDNSKEAASPKIATSDKIATTESVIWIPNAFSPDDPVNDKVRTFKVFPSDNASIVNYEIYIYSRGGRLVYHSRDINAGWDGTAKGHAQPMGTYVYVIEVTDTQNGLQHYKGTITLIR